MLDRRFFAEMLGTFLLVLVGCGAIVADALQPMGALAVSIAWGAIVAIVIATMGHISGAHINPAVSLALAATGHVPWRRVAPYIGAQILGATMAALLLRAGFGTIAHVGATIPTVSTGLLLGLETVATAFLVFVIVATTDARFAFPAPVAIGGAVFLCALTIGGFTGASMNPARSIGPAIAAGLDPLAVMPYIAAPIIGGLVGAFAFEGLRARSTPAAVESTRAELEAA